MIAFIFDLLPGLFAAFIGWLLYDAYRERQWVIERNGWRLRFIWLPPK